MGTEKQYATAQGEPHNLSPTAAERQLTALLEAMAQGYFAEPNLFRTEFDLCLCVFVCVVCVCVCRVKCV